MDPYSFSINSASELRLRRHIREILLPYARIHLTSDHVAFTEKVVEEASVYIPIAFPTADQLISLASPSNTRVCAHGGCNIISSSFRSIRSSDAFLGTS